MDFYDVAEMPGNFAGDHPVAAGAVIAAGATVALNAAGDAVQAASTVTGHAIGRAETDADNTGGAAGAVKVRVRRGLFAYSLDGTNPPTKADVGARMYFTAPDVVSKLNTVTCKGGFLVGFDESGKALVDLTRSTKV